MRSTRCQPSAANRLDIDATWMRVMSKQIPVAASSGSASAQASTTRSKSVCSPPPPSCPLARRCSSPSPSCAVTSASARALLGLVGRGHLRHGVGVHEGLRTVELVEGSDQGLEALSLGRAGTAPGGQSDPVAQTPAEREEIHLAFRAQFVGRGLDGQLDVAQVGGDVLPSEELVRQHPPPGEHLVGQLAPEHPPVGHALAGRLLGQPVQGGDAQRREEEEIAVAATVHDEGVPQTRPGLGQRGHRVLDHLVPGQPDPGGDHRHRIRARRPTDRPGVMVVSPLRRRPHPPPARPRPVRRR